MSSATDPARTGRVWLAAWAASAALALAFTLAAATKPAPRAEAPHAIVIPPAAEPAAARIAPDLGLLRVCADPNNFPFSDRDRGGFENAIAQIVGDELGRRVVYFWQPQRRGFVRTTLNAGQCDVIAAVPASLDTIRATKPYYRSSYVFVSRPGVRAPASLDDPRLRRLRIGIQITGEDYANPPAAEALAARRIVDNVRGYTVYGDYSRPHPSWGVLEALSRGDVDLAIVWGPLAGYYARRVDPRLRLHDVSSARPGEMRAFTFDIAMGVRRRDTRLAEAIDAVLVSRRAEIHRVLSAYGVPQ